MAKRDYILHNFWWKVTSLLLAIIVWFVVYAETAKGGGNLMRTVYFPRHTLAVMRDSNDKRAVRVTPTEVDITLKVPLMDVSSINDSDIQTFVDLSDIDATHKKARIRVYVPQGVTLESLEPDEATVEIIE
jgi:YbbR domain-containing protein